MPIPISAPGPYLLIAREDAEAAIHSLELSALSEQQAPVDAEELANSFHATAAVPVRENDESKPVLIERDSARRAARILSRFQELAAGKEVEKMAAFLLAIRDVEQWLLWVAHHNLPGYSADLVAPTLSADMGEPPPGERSQLLSQVLAGVKQAVRTAADEGFEQGAAQVLGWLTCRPNPVVFSSHHDAVLAAELAGHFTEYRQRFGTLPPATMWPELKSPVADTIRLGIEPSGLFHLGEAREALASLLTDAERMEGVPADVRGPLTYVLDKLQTGAGRLVDGRPDIPHQHLSTARQVMAELMGDPKGYGLADLPPTTYGRFSRVLGLLNSLVGEVDEGVPNAPDPEPTRTWEDEAAEAAIRIGAENIEQMRAAGERIRVPRPPLGVKPKHLWLEHRAQELLAAIGRILHPEVEPDEVLPKWTPKARDWGRAEDWASELSGVLTEVRWAAEDREGHAEDGKAEEADPWADMPERLRPENAVPEILARVFGPDEDEDEDPAERIRQLGIWLHAAETERDLARMDATRLRGELHTERLRNADLRAESAPGERRDADTDGPLHMGDLLGAWLRMQPDPEAALRSLNHVGIIWKELAMILSGTFPMDRSTAERLAVTTGTTAEAWTQAPQQAVPEGYELPDRVTTSPAEMLREEFLHPGGLPAQDFIERSGMEWAHLTQFLLGFLGVDERRAEQLANGTGTTAEFWLRLQSQHDLSRGRMARAVPAVSEERAAAIEAIREQMSKGHPNPEGFMEWLEAQDDATVLKIAEG